MLLLLTIALVLIGAVALIIGFIQDSLVPIYISIGCSLLAAGVLIAFSRMSRRGPSRVVQLPAEASGGPTPTAAPAMAGATAGAASTPGSEVPVVEPAADDAFVSAVPVPDEPLAEGDEPAGAEVLAVVSAEDDQAEVDPEPVTEAITILSAEQVAAAQASRFPELPIPAYESLKVSQILPQLADLSPEELQAVRAAEQAGKARDTILRRIDALVRGGARAGATGGGSARTTVLAPRAGATAPQGSPAPRRARTTRTAAGTPKRAAAKATSTKATSTKATSTKATSTKATAAKKAAGTGAGAPRKASASKTAGRASAAKTTGRTSAAGTAATRKTAGTKAGAGKSTAKKASGRSTNRRA